MISREQKRKKRHNRVRAKVVGSAERPRLSVFKSNKDIYVQLIDDAKGLTIVSANSLKIADKTLSEKSVMIGSEIAKLAKSKSISKVVFDRSGYLYTGLIKALAESAREGGLEF
ncbi:MAG: ribosomal protein [Candidatus Parcubacteria bacterium]|jgi:large subunit ribosomal protein L18